MFQSEGISGHTHGRRMENVIDRLSFFTEPNKAKRLMHAIDTYKNGWSTDRESAEARFISLQEQFFDKQKKGIVDMATAESYQASLAGYLFAENKRIFEEKSGGTGYSTEKESRQIEAVARALDKQHLHMGTGEGKSSVVIPISAIVEAATNGKGKVVVGTANSSLVEELTENINTYTEMIKSLSCQTHRISSAGEKQGDRTVKQLMRDSLLKNESGMQAKNQQYDTFWASVIDTTNEPHEEKYFESPKKYNPGEISIYVGEERNIVFDWMGNRKTFEKGCPTIFMDEAHVPFDRGSPYAQTSGSEALSNETIQAGISEYLANYIVAQRLQLGLKGGLIQASKGGYELSEKGLERVQATDITHISIDGKDEDSLAFMNGVDIVLKNIGHVHPTKRAQIAQNLLVKLQEFVPQKVGPVEEEELVTNRSMYFESVGNEIAKMLPNKEKMFTTNKSGKNQLRDAYIDQLLSDNKYNPTTQCAVLAIAGKFEPIERSIAYKNSTYASFVYGVQDKIVAFSGTLMTPDPLKKRMKRGAFAAFLESTTKREVHMLTSPEIKSFPKPRLCDEPEDLYRNIIRDLEIENRHPTLIVDNGSLESAQETHRRMVEKFGKRRVRLLSSKPADGDIKEVRRYERNLDLYRKQLAAGEIDFLISSGSAALGTNFVKKDATFPDLKTITIGMPESEEKMSQTIGRRRALEGDLLNHSWYLTQADIEQYITYFKDTKDIPFYDFKKGKDEMRGDIQRAKDKPDDLFKLMVELWDKARAARAVDTDFAVGYDILMSREVMPLVERYMKTQIALKILGYSEQELQYMYGEGLTRTKKEHLVQFPIDPKIEEREIIELRRKRQLIDLTYEQLGAPSTMYNDIQEAYSFLPPVPKSASNAISTAAINRLLELKKFIFTNPEGKVSNEVGFGLNAYLDNWFEYGKEAVSDYIDTAKIRENIDLIVGEKNTETSFVDLRPFGTPPGIEIKLLKSLNKVNWRGEEYEIHLLQCSDKVESWITPVFYNRGAGTTLAPVDSTSNMYALILEESVDRVKEIQIQSPHTAIHYKTKPMKDEQGVIIVPGGVVDMYALKIKTYPTPSPV